MWGGGGEGGTLQYVTIVGKCFLLEMQSCGEAGNLKGSMKSK